MDPSIGVQDFAAPAVLEVCSLLSGFSHHDSSLLLVLSSSAPILFPAPSHVLILCVFIAVSALQSCQRNARAAEETEVLRSENATLQEQLDARQQRRQERDILADLRAAQTAVHGLQEAAAAAAEEEERLLDSCANRKRT